MLSKKMQDALNDQLNWELYSGYIYLAMAADFANKNLMGFASWMRVQAQEELVHAMGIYTFIPERGGQVVLTQVGEPPTTWKTPLAAFETAYEHECGVSE